MSSDVVSILLPIVTILFTSVYVYQLYTQCDSLPQDESLSAGFIGMVLLPLTFYITFCSFLEKQTRYKDFFKKSVILIFGITALVFDAIFYRFHLEIDFLEILRIEILFVIGWWVVVWLAMQIITPPPVRK